MLIARVPCGPPPCTIATRSVAGRAVSVPVGAIAQTNHDARSHASKPIAPCHWPRRASGRDCVPFAGRKATDRQGRTRSGTPPRSARSRRRSARRRRGGRRPGRSAASPAALRRTGSTSRNASASVCAAGRPITRHGPVGATPSRRRRGSRRRSPPRADSRARVNDHIHAIPGYSHAAPNSHPRAARRGAIGFSPSDISNMAMPMNASGQMPHGGSDSATTEPAADRQRSRGREAWDSDRHQRATIVAGACRAGVNRSGASARCTTMRCLVEPGG